MSRKAIIFFGTIFFLSLFAQAQETSKIDTYENFFNGSLGTNSDSLFAVAESKLDDAISAHDLTRKAEAHKELGLLHLTISNDFEKAMDEFIRALVIEDSLKLKADQVITYIAIADVFGETGNFQKADEMLDQALELNRPLNDNRTTITILIKLGQIHSQMGSVDEATEDFQGALNFTEEIEGTPHEAEAYFQLAKIEAKKSAHEKALSMFKTSLAKRRALRDKRNEAICLNEIGGLYLEMKNTDKALANYVVSLEIYEALKNKEGLATVYNNVGILYYKTGNIERAQMNLELALAAAKEAQAQQQMRKSYEYLSLVFKDLKDYQKALGFKEDYVTISDFIQQERDEQKLLEAQNRYEFEKKEGQIQKLENIKIAREKELKEEKETRNLLITIVAFVAVVLLLVFYGYLSKRKTNKILQVANNTVRDQNAKLQELNATKDKFFSIISHDLKGPLNSLTSFSGLLINHTDSLSKDEIKMLAKDLDKSLKNLFALLENLLEWSRSQTGNIEFKPEPFDIAALLKQNQELLQQQAQNKKISLVLQGELNVVINAHRNSVNTVVRNLVSNAIKFTPGEGTVTLKTSTAENKVIVSISDTGVGMSKEVMDKLFRIDTKHTTKGTADEKGTGLGLILCKEFIEKNGGRIWVDSVVGKGSNFSFELPLVAEPVPA
ncbi:MAG TPA: tetratricopeptide repeat-containing sensor histidine kinase [Chryseosolibacter sp.]